MSRTAVKSTILCLAMFSLTNTAQADFCYCPSIEGEWIEENRCSGNRDAGACENQGCIVGFFLPPTCAPDGKGPYCGCRVTWRDGRSTEYDHKEVTASGCDIDVGKRSWRSVGASKVTRLFRKEQIGHEMIDCEFQADSKLDSGDVPKYSSGYDSSDS